MEQNKNNSFGWILRFAAQCRGKLAASVLLAVLGAQYPARLCERYKIDREQASQSEPYELLELIGHKRGMLMRGGEIDTERASAMLLDEYRAGRLGRITLEFPPAD